MPSLTIGRRIRLRHLIRSSPVLADVDHVLEEDGVRLRPGGDREATLSLEAMAKQVLGVPVEEWPDLVNELLRRAIVSLNEPRSRDLPTEQILPRIHYRLVPGGSAFLTDMTYAPELLGMRRCFVVDNPYNVQFLDDADVARHGRARLDEAATANLPHQQNAVDAEHDGVHVMVGDHMASGLLVLQRMIAGVADDPPGMVVAAVPNQQTLIFDVSGRPLPDAVELVRTLAAQHYEDEANPLSRETFTLLDGQLAMVGTKVVATDDHLGESVRSSPALAGRDVRLGEDRITVSGTHDHVLFGNDAVSDALLEGTDTLDAHLRLALILADDPPAFAESADWVLARTYPQLCRPELRTDPSWWSYARDTVPGLLEVLCLDLIAEGGGVHTFHDSHLLRHGEERVRETALHNLRDVRPQQHDDHNGVQVLLGGPHMASTVLILDEVVARTTGERELPDGVLVAMPHRQVLLYHVLRDAHMGPAMAGMKTNAERIYRDDPQGLSPNLFWWRDGVLVPVTYVDDDGTVLARFTPGFAEVYRRLVPRPEANRHPVLAEDFATFADQIVPRWWHPSDGGPVEYAPTLAQGLVPAYAVQRDGRFFFLLDEDVRRHGLERVRAAAQANFSQDTTRISAEQAHGIWVIVGGPNVAASILAIPDLIETLTGTREAPHGVLVCVPANSTILLAVPSDDEDVNRLVPTMAKVCADINAEDSISHRVYHWLAEEFSVVRG